MRGVEFTKETCLCMRSVQAVNTCSLFFCAGGGFGDPHVVTFDGNKYSFNGLGDYVIFKSG